MIFVGARYPALKKHTMQAVVVLSLAVPAALAASSAPVAKPAQFHLAWTSRADEMWVSWVTLGPPPTGGYRARCEYSTQAPLSAYYRTVPAATATYRDGGPPSCRGCVVLVSARAPAINPAGVKITEIIP